MKLSFILTLFFTFNTFACISAPIYIDVDKAQKSIEAVGRSIIFKSTQKIVFPKVEDLNFKEVKLLNFSGGFQYEAHTRPGLTKDFSFKIKTDKEIEVSLLIPPLQRGGCDDKNGVIYK